MDPIDAMLIQRWIDDMHQPRQDYSGYYFVENGRVSGFALLRKCEFDTFQQHIDPWLLEFIYVCKKSRRQGKASKLVKHVLHDHSELTAVCSNTSSTALFKLNGFTQLDVMNDIMRFP